MPHATVKRWPIILTGVVDELNKINAALSGSSDDELAKLAEGKQLINEISGLIYEMRHDKGLSPLQGAFLLDIPPHLSVDLNQLSLSQILVFLTTRLSTMMSSLSWQRRARTSGFRHPGCSRNA